MQSIYDNPDHLAPVAAGHHYGVMEAREEMRVDEIAERTDGIRKWPPRPHSRSPLSLPTAITQPEIYQR